MTSAAQALLWLQIGPRQTILRPDDAAAAAIPPLELGLVTTTAQFFRPHPPTPLNLEAAIAAVEDELFKIRHLAPAPGAVQRAALFSDDAVIRRIAAFALGAGAVVGEGTMGPASARPVAMVLRVEAVERAFEDLAALSAGGRLSGAPWAAEPEAGAVLLILREFMHHLGFGQIELPAPGSAPAPEPAA